MHVRFFVPGSAVPQGSHTAIVIPGRPHPGARRKCGCRGVIVDQQNMAKKTRPAGALDRWRESVRSAAMVAANRAALDEPIVIPVRLRCDFKFERSNSHWTATYSLSAEGRRRPFPGKTHGDLSKLVRAVEDSLTGVVYVDDSLVVEHACTKRWCEYGEAEGAVIEVSW